MSVEALITANITKVCLEGASISSSFSSRETALAGASAAADRLGRGLPSSLSLMGARASPRKASCATGISAMLPPMGAQAVDRSSSAPHRVQVWLGSTRLALHLAPVAALAGSSLPRFRSLRTSGFFLAFSGVASVMLVRYLGAADVADIVALRIVAYACWLYGAFGLWTLLSPEALEASGQALLRMRGQSQLLFRSQILGIARHLTLGMFFAGMPGMVAAVAISPSIPTLLLRVGLFALALIYLASLGFVLGLRSEERRVGKTFRSARHTTE